MYCNQWWNCDQESFRLVLGAKYNAFSVKNKVGKVEKFHTDPETGTAHKVNMRSGFMSRLGYETLFLQKIMM